MLYGDHAVTFSTLKAEVSHLRQALSGQLASRPYRLLMPIATCATNGRRLTRWLVRNRLPSSEKS